MKHQPNINLYKWLLNKFEKNIEIFQRSLTKKPIVSYAYPINNQASGIHEKLTPIL